MMTQLSVLAIIAGPALVAKAEQFGQALRGLRFHGTEHEAEIFYAVRVLGRSQAEVAAEHDCTQQSVAAALVRFEQHCGKPVPAEFCNAAPAPQVVVMSPDLLAGMAARPAA